MGKNEEKKLAKQIKKEKIRKSLEEDKLRIKKVKIASKIDKIENSIDDVVEYIEKNNIDVQNKEKINVIAEELQNVKKGLDKVEEDVENAEKTAKKGFNIFGITIWQIFAYFIIYSIIGYIVETTFAFLAEGVIESRQSFLYGPFCAIYGLGAAVMIVGLQKFKKRNITLIVGGIVLGAITEYLVSLLGELVFGVKWWDYSNMPFNIQGRICATYSIAWGALGLILVKYINPLIDKFVNSFPRRTLKVVTSAFMIFLLCDWLISSFALEMFYVRMSEAHNIEIQTNEGFHELSKKIYNNEYVKAFVDTVWSDEVMVKTFPNLRVTTKKGTVIYVSNLYKNIEPYHLKVFEPVLFDLREEKLTHKSN